MSIFVVCPKCQEENIGSLLNCAKCGTSLVGIPRQSRATPQEIDANSQANTVTFKYESARVAHLMDEYSKITNLKECREWEQKARIVASYMSETVAKTEQFIVVEKRRLEQASDKTEKTHAEIGLMQFENFMNIIGGQLERLNQTLENLPKGENDGEPVKLPPDNVTLRKRKSFTLPINLNSTAVQLLVIVIVVLILAYFANSR